ncbi:MULTISPECIES: recombinase family protein [Methylobacterium]|uniref:Resolvase domain-containing protein n=1 Tax=Methylobacterium aquaticum TaxID=270351 RepID=A0A0C6F8U4_9HYPH|nr:recombinase family protein [Methylobacterium aquaticum]BAQ49206.1 resolvase domain-containing protein [Methylobacterium aquaticum]
MWSFRQGDQDEDGLDRFTTKGRQTSIHVRQERAGRRALELAPIIEEIRADGSETLQAIARALNARRIPTARGREWSAVQVQRLLAQRAGMSPTDEDPGPLVTPAKRSNGGRSGVTTGQLAHPVPSTSGG